MCTLQLAMKEARREDGEHLGRCFTEAEAPISGGQVGLKITRLLEGISSRGKNAVAQ